MPLDPQIEKILNSVPGGLALPSGDPAEARDVFEKVCEATARYGDEIVVGEVEDIEVPGPAGDALEARIYRPDTDAATPTLAFFHGGGFVIGSIDSHDMQTRLLCRDADVTVISFNYRLAPEHKFPGGLEDVMTAVEWSHANRDLLGGADTPFAIGGDSAGGNLSAVTAQQMQGRDDVEIDAQLLLYPVLDYAGDYPSREENGDGYLLTRKEMGWFGLNYLPSLDVLEDPRLSPMLGELGGLPPAIVVTAEFDPLRDEGNTYAEKLTAAGVPVTHRCFDGMIHGFFGWGPLSDAAALANSQICADLKSALGEPSLTL